MLRRILHRFHGVLYGILYRSGHILRRFGCVFYSLVHRIGR